MKAIEPASQPAVATALPARRLARSGLRRVIVIGWHATPILFSILRDLHRFIVFGAPRELTEVQHHRRAARIRLTLEQLGALFIKVGQVLSARADLLPPPYLGELSKLQDAVAPLPLSDLRPTIEREYQRPLEEVFESLDETALAAASIGQVHRARYRQQAIVLKLLRPGVAAQLRTDFTVAQFLLRFLSERLRLWQAGFISNIVSEVASVMIEEVDYAQERMNATEIRALLSPRKDVIIPATIPELCTANVLALEYCHGTKVSQLEELRARGTNLEQLMLRLVELYGHMILVKGIYQADPHPGNIFLAPDGRIILVDFGIVRRLSAATRDTLVALIVAALKKDVEAVVENLYKIGLVKPSADRAMVRQVAVKVAELHFQGLTTRTRLQEVAQTLMNSFTDFPIQVPPELVYVFRTFSLLEGLGTRFRPGWNMLADGAPAARTVLQEYLVESRGLLDTIKEYLDIIYRRLFT